MANMLVVVWAFATTARAEDVWNTPYAGVMHLDRTTGTPWSIHAVLVDLCAPGIRVRASSDEERAQVTSAFAAEVGAAIAVNGDFFNWGAGYDTSGIAVGDGEPWPENTPDDRWALAAFGLERAELFSPLTVLEAEPWMSETIGGVPELLVGGVTIDDYPGWSFCAVRHPRTALGLSEDRRTLILVTVDGRSSESEGMTCPELAALMAELGAHDAINLDGGGSTAMVMGGAVVNQPSDGSERVVGNHLGVVVDGSTGVDACPGGGQRYTRRIGRRVGELDQPSPEPSGPDLSEASGVANGCSCQGSGGLPGLLALVTLWWRQP